MVMWLTTVPTKTAKTHIVRDNMVRCSLCL